MTALSSLFFWKMKLKIMKSDWNQIQISVLEKRTLLRKTLLHFIRTGKVLDQKIIERRLLPKLTFTGSDLNNNQS